MKSLWTDKEAAAFVERYRPDGVNEDLALRVYTTRLLGSDSRLVLHGGGNSSVKTRATDIVGETWDVLCVKGSGWDMGDIEPEGLPAVKLGPLLQARKLPALSDEDMVALQRSNLIDPASPNPSVETLLHAYLPHKYVDHTHSTAILAVTNQENGEEICQQIFGNRMTVVSYIMPGFDLARLAAEVYEANPDVAGLVLLKHGIFTFGENARESYERMIEMVSLAEDYIARVPGEPFTPVELPEALPSQAEVATVLRGACAYRSEGSIGRVVSEFRSSGSIRNYVDGADAASYATRGVTTPDLVIRVKQKPLITPAPEAGKLDAYRDIVAQEVERYIAEYKRYFDENNAQVGGIKVMVDPMPRLVLVPGMGMFALARSKRAARVAADVGENIIVAVTDAETVGSFQPLPDRDLFDLEYWSLEQAKLGKSTDAPLAGQVAVVTGGAGAIGRATAALLSHNGAHVAVLDKAAGGAEAVAVEIGNDALAVACDVTSLDDVNAAFVQVCEFFGGVDILVSNAGAAWEGEIGTLPEETLRESFELNFFAHQRVAQQAVAIMLRQDTGGVLLFNASKQAVNPGPGFGAYGLPKAATLLLSRQYALEYGRHGIRSNAVNADRIRGGLLTSEMIASRAGARGLGEEEYMAGNLLRSEVAPEHVAKAFLDLALAERTTADVTTVDGGNIAAALR